jgi:drug/metabolite transporter (DMT)-like permease
LTAEKRVGMKDQKSFLGHLFAFICAVVWGITYISTKVLLEAFSPIEILWIRFLMAYLVLWVLYPKRSHFHGWKEELLFMGAGLSGVSLYFFLENTALTYTYASNVGVIVSIAPFFTGLLAMAFLKEERPGGRFFLGFAAAAAGIVLMSFGGNSVKLNPLGDLLAVIASLTWGAYSVLTRKIGEGDHPVLLLTRKIFFYGLVFMIPMFFVYDFSPKLGNLMQGKYAGNLLFLGLIASAACYVLWNKSIEYIGAVKSSLYIYLIPVVTLVSSGLILKERLAGLALAGAGLTLAGLLISEGKKRE